MHSNARKSLCPSRFCPAANPMQALVSEAEAEEVKEEAIVGAIRCSSCGCVWVRDPRGVDHVLGMLRRKGTRYEWRSDYTLSGRNPSSL